MNPETSGQKIFNMFDIIQRDALGLQILPNNKIFFRTSTLVDIFKCSYKAYYYLSADNNNGSQNKIDDIKYARVGALIHELVEFLLLQHRFNLTMDSLSKLSNVVDHLSQQIFLDLGFNIYDFIPKDNLIKTAIIAASNILKNFNVTHIESVFVVEDENFILKLTPDIISDQGIVDLKTKFSDIPKNVSYEHALQMNVYMEYLGLPSQLFYISVNNQQYAILKPGTFKDLKDRLRILSDKILNNKLEKNIGSHCKLCRFKDVCMSTNGKTTDI